MSEFLNLIRDLVSTLFTGNFRISRKRRELKKTVRELRQKNPEIYKPHTNEVLPVFGETLYSFSRQIRSLTRLFDKTILNDHPPTAERFRDHLANALLSEEEALARTHFQYAAMKTRLTEAASFEEALRDLNAEFDRWLALFKQPLFADWNREITQVERLAALSRYPFNKLLAFFDPGIVSGEAGYQPSFSPVLVQHLTQDLMDFHFSIAGLDAGPTVSEHVVRLHQRLMKIPDGDDEAKIRKIVSWLDGRAKKYFSRLTLLCLIRLASDNPHLVLPEDRETTDYLGSYLGRLRTRFELDREKVVREHAENAVTFEVKQLFQGRELLDVTGYDEALSRELAAAGHDGFSHLPAARILKSFVMGFFEPSIKESVKQLLIEGFFESKVFRDRFVGSFHQTQSVMDDLTVFEQTLAEPGAAGTAAIRRALEKQQDGKAVSTSLSQLVETVNGNVARLIETATGAFARFHRTLAELLADAKEHAPAIMSNIRVIGGERNPERLRELSAGAEQLAAFLSIMRRFTVIEAPRERPGAPQRSLPGSRPSR
jgi:hypothetical protein